MTKQHLVALALISLMVVLMVGNAACQTAQPAGTTAETPPSCPAPMLAAPSAQVQALTDDIRLLQVLNRMQFTPAEITALLPAVDALQAQRGQFDTQLAALDTQLEAALTGQRDLLLADKPVTAEVQKRISDLQTSRANLQEKAQLALAQSSAALRKSLTAPQLAIVTGSSEAQLQAREMLEWLRTLADSDFTEEAKANAEGLASPDKGLDQALLMQLFTTARKMSATDFAKSEAELAERLSPAYGLSEAEANARIASTFGHPRMPALLREKAKLTDQGAG